MLRVALIAVLTVHSSTLWRDVRSFTANGSLHRLENGGLHPSGTVALGRFLRQEVEVFGCLVGQAHGYDGLSLPHHPLRCIG